MYQINNHCDKIKKAGKFPLLLALQYLLLVIDFYLLLMTDFLFIIRIKKRTSPVR